LWGPKKSNLIEGTDRPFVENQLSGVKERDESP
jgi:hypothetical protein